MEHASGELGAGYRSGCAGSGSSGGYSMKVYGSVVIDGKMIRRLFGVVVMHLEEALGQGCCS